MNKIKGYFIVIAIIALSLIVLVGRVGASTIEDSGVQPPVSLWDSPVYLQDSHPDFGDSSVQFSSVLDETTIEATCTDSDGGLDYFVAGFVSGTGANGWPYTKYDVCSTSTELKEFYCNGTTPWPKFYVCPNGCIDGACAPETCTDGDGDGYAIEGGGCGLIDCNDSDPNVNPGAAEVCTNGIDDDCDGSADLEDSDCVVCTDTDGDGYAVEGGACGLVDCNDANAAVHPGAVEVCTNGIDDDCDGAIDSLDPDCANGPSCMDSDGGLDYFVAGFVSGIGANGWPYTKYDVCSTSTELKEFYCNGTSPWPKFYVCPNGCLDGACAPEICTDGDGDGYAIEGDACGLVDCNDSNAAVHPGAVEVCTNGIDDDCDGAVDQEDSDCVACTDGDGDGYAVEGGVCGPVDCNDANAAIHPGAIENCSNTIDDNCNGLIDSKDPACSGVPNIVVVGWDGLQRDHFLQCFNKTLPECSNGLPNIQALSGGKIFNNTITDGATSTKPGWAQIFTGYDAEVTGVYDLKIYQPIPLGYTVFEKIENHFGPDNVTTMFISAKGVHTGDACVGEWTYLNGVPVIEELGQPWCYTSDQVINPNAIDYFELDKVRDDDLGNRALDLLEVHQDDLFFSLFLFRTPDIIGHLSGEDSVEYSEAIIYDDYWLGRIVSKIHELGIADHTLVYVVTDHGFDEGQSVHLNAPYGILATNDPQVVRSGDRKDIGPTFLERYGISLGAIGPAPAVNGYPLYSVPPLACIPEGGTFVDYPGAPACCSGLTLINLDIKYGGCRIASGGVGDDSGYCTLCGNGVCTAPENPCNCPEDCSK